LSKRAPALVDARLIKAYEHPIRVEILCLLRAGPSSPTRLSRQLQNVSLNLVSHHIKVLQELGCIELVETVEKRGAIEHLYRALDPRVLGDREWRELTPEVRYALTGKTLRLLSGELARALTAGTLDEEANSHISRSPLKLDKEGWSEVAAILERALGEVLEAGEKSIDRIADSGEESVDARVAIMHFTVPEES
jgi:DNA-binding transcriptional ArsR family regulator